MAARQLAFLFAVFSVVSFFILNGCAPVSESSSSGMTKSAGGSSTQEPGSPAGHASVSGVTSLDALQTGQLAASGPLKNIYFAFDQYNLRAEAREILKANAAWLMKHPSARVEIEGHCDERGTNEYNLALGTHRARVAMDYLVTLGVSAERVSTISYGEEVPVCRENSEECWQRNRHARFVVLPAEPSS